jgi:hypothetical protein
VPICLRALAEAEKHADDEQGGEAGSDRGQGSENRPPADSEAHDGPGSEPVGHPAADERERHVAEEERAGEQSKLGAREVQFGDDARSGDTESSTVAIVQDKHQRGHGEDDPAEAEATLSGWSVGLVPLDGLGYGF